MGGYDAEVQTLGRTPGCCGLKFMELPVHRPRHAWLPGPSGRRAGHREYDAEVNESPLGLATLRLDLRCTTVVSDYDLGGLDQEECCKPSWFTALSPIMALGKQLRSSVQCRQEK